MVFDIPMYLGTHRIQRGTHTHLVTLPQSAVKVLHLKAGDEMDITLQPDGSISFKKTQPDEQHSEEVDV